MKVACAVVMLGCALLEARAHPFPRYSYSTNVDSLSLGSADGGRGGLAYSRYYNPYYEPRAAGGGLAAFMFQRPEEPARTGQYLLPDRRRQADSGYVPPPQQNEVFYSQPPEKPAVTEAAEFAESTDRAAEPFSTTARFASPELAEPEIEEVEEPVQKAKKRVSKRKQVKKPIEDEDEDDEDAPRLPAGAFFPMFFGWGGRSGAGGGPGGATAVANAYSTGRGGVASSHATAYGAPRTDAKL